MSDDRQDLAEVLSKRLGRPQRHRLLQGYPRALDTGRTASTARLAQLEADLAVPPSEHEGEGEAIDAVVW